MFEVGDDEVSGVVSVEGRNSNRVSIRADCELRGSIYRDDSSTRGRDRREIEGLSVCFCEIIDCAVSRVCDVQPPPIIEESRSSVSSIE